MLRAEPRNPITMSSAATGSVHFLEISHHTLRVVTYRMVNGSSSSLAFAVLKARAPYALHAKHGVPTAKRLVITIVFVSRIPERNRFIGLQTDSIAKNYSSNEYLFAIE